MADFCKQCTKELFGEEASKSLNFGIKDDEYTTILCEGCGRNVRVQNDGHRIECNTCQHGDEGVCMNVSGDNYGHQTEISGDWCCSNYERISEDSIKSDTGELFGTDEVLGR